MRVQNFRKKKWVMAVGMMMTLVVIIILAVLINAVKTNDSDIEDGVPRFLTKEEKEEWKNKEKDETEIYVYVNTYLEAEDDGVVNLRLANPPYCAYPIQVSVCDRQDEKKSYYVSGLIRSGESIERAKFDKLPQKKGSYEVKVKYKFFQDDKGKDLVGEHSVAGELIIKEEK